MNAHTVLGESRKHVVCVDSSPELLDMMGALLHDEGYQCTQILLEGDTFDQLIRLRPDALIVDLGHNSTAAWRLVERISTHSVTSIIPIIISSTDDRALDKARERHSRYNSRRYLPKPFDVAVLCAMLEELVGPFSSRSG